MLGALARGIYSLSDHLGLSSMVRDSAWRGERLLVLCWHGISPGDESRWNPWLYVTPALFRDRLRILAEEGYNVLSLDQALRRLWAKDLPPRSVAITFDDGFYDFFLHAAPALEEFGFPATLYLTTYYVDHQTPVFNLIVSYMLWKNSAPGRRLPDGSPLTNAAETEAACARILQRADRDGATGAQRDEIARSLAAELGVGDYGEAVRRRTFGMMRPDEIRGLLKSGLIGIEAHTHRHRTPPDPELMTRELCDNRDRIEQLTGRRPVHFCYPTGVYRREYFPLLEEQGFQSATTCEVRMASARDHRYLIPRLLDHQDLSAEDYRSWLTGAHSLGRTA
jgi:peptidoglycan/xylan/chitin deacetylase (PgdA/CDA1 family)